MDSNRDDAQRCLNLASEALEGGDLDKAKRLLEKSRRMYPKLSDAQDRFATALKLARAAAGDSATNSKRHGTNSDGTTKAVNDEDDASSSTTRNVTPEMEAAVRNIQKARMKSHYEVLDIERNADEVKIKRAYRRLALKLHPDRNFAHGADEAFKRVSQAFVTLSDRNKRAHYDEFGTDTDSLSSTAATTHERRHHRGGGSRVYMNGVPLNEFFNMNDTGMSADDLFEFIFSNGGHIPRGHFTQARRRRSMSADSDDDDRENVTGGRGNNSAGPHERSATSSMWTQLKPIAWIMIIVLMAVIISDETDKQRFSLQRTLYYSERRTSGNGVQYFVPRNSRVWEGDRHLWSTIERAALQQYGRSCAAEQEVERDLEYKSRSWLVGKKGREKYKRELSQFRKPWCQEYFRLRTRLQ